MADSEHTPAKSQETAPAERAGERPVFTPYVDIYEDDDGLTLIADMPGVPPDGVDVRAEKETLTLYGHVPDMALEGGNPVYTEYRNGDYERAFTISHAVDCDKIEATMANGLLTVRLPKAERAKERKVPVKPG